ncbi:NaeI family type II restriction endonuclease [Streptomyces sp. TLI_105]|uniref:NaeI family type II restriction endonuclease n=1 Tax=Streptomyces sp. TLI_105 TaxID=1881019 RepID=UPI0008986F2D|nr:NaeI family type II restriction endonuclease [Streptomyces sp. TLI_105]SED35478.1 Restriction endonuclease NaeI [Streptomyces sp. TLI_105]
MGRLKLQPLGSECQGKDCRSEGKILRDPSDDMEIQLILGELGKYDLATGFTEAIRSSIDYVLDGARTGRYDLLSKDVHPGERASVGAKLEYEVQRVFKWKKSKPLDIELAGVPVDLKSTVGDNWAIPTEAHCHICICTQIRLKDKSHRSWLIRTHTSWLYRGKGNKDGKRGIAVDARNQWGVPLYDWTRLPINPLTLLTESQAEQVFDGGQGQEVRLLRLFTYLPKIVIERSVILTVCAGKQDPMRRARAIKEKATEKGILLLCGKWVSDRVAAEGHGFTLGPGDWVAIPDESAVKETTTGTEFLF